MIMVSHRTAFHTLRSCRSRPSIEAGGPRLRIYARTRRRTQPNPTNPDPKRSKADGSGTAVMLKLPEPSTRPEVKLFKLNPCKLVFTPSNVAMFTESVNGPLKNPPTGWKLTSTLKSPLAKPGNAWDCPATKAVDWPTRMSSAAPETVTVPPGVPTGEATIAEFKDGSTNNFSAKLVKVAVSPPGIP